MPSANTEARRATYSYPFRKIKPPRWEYLVLGIIIVGLIALGTAGFMVTRANEEPRRVSDRFLYSLLNNDAEAAYELTANPYRQAVSDTRFKEVVETFNQEIGATPRVIDHRIERSRDDVYLATVEYEIPGTDGNRVIVKLIKENDSWLVLNINTVP